ncbi:MAG: hypothetical protein P1V18_06365 [Candidatus Gracilibacteria bacterium]|nr:hypothetical protein [Candidatus Gracilibacteria bacterium]
MNTKTLMRILTALFCSISIIISSQSPSISIPVAQAADFSVPLSGNINLNNTQNLAQISFGTGDFAFQSSWSRADNLSIHGYNIEKGIGIAKNLQTSIQVTNASIFLDATNSVIAREGDFVILKNNQDYYALLQIREIKAVTHFDTQNTLNFNYLIQTNGTDDFSKLLSSSLNNSRISVPSSGNGSIYTTGGSGIRFDWIDPPNGNYFLKVLNGAQELFFGEHSFQSAEIDFDRFSLQGTETLRARFSLFSPNGQLISDLPFFTIPLSSSPVLLKTLEQSVIVNHNPVLLASPQNQTIKKDETLILNTLSQFFSDADGDNLSYIATSNPSGIVSHQISTNDLILTSVTEGSTTVTITAIDPGNLSISSSFTVNVTPPIDTTPPEIINFSLEKAEIDVRNDPQGLVNFSITLRDPSGPNSGIVILNSPSGLQSRIGGIVPQFSSILLNGDVLFQGTIAINQTPEAGEWTITTIRILDNESNELNLTTPEEIRDQIGSVPSINVIANLSPEIISSPNNQTIGLGSDFEINDLSQFFSDPNNDTLTFTATAENQAIVSTSIENNTLTISGLLEGSTNVNITATDPAGETATVSFSTTVISIPVISGYNIVDHSIQNGTQTIGSGPMLFTVSWISRDSYNISAKNENTNIGITRLGRSPNPADPFTVVSTQFTDVDILAPPGISTVTGGDGDFIILKNSNGYYALLQITSIASTVDNRDPVNRVGYNYLIQTNKTADFSTISSPVLTTQRVRFPDSLQLKTYTISASGLRFNFDPSDSLKLFNNNQELSLGVPNVNALELNYRHFNLSGNEMLSGIFNQIPFTIDLSQINLMPLLRKTSSPIISPAFISISGATGTNDIFKSGDSITISWDNSINGDNNGDQVSQVTADLSMIGGEDMAIMTNNGSGLFSHTLAIPDGLFVENINAQITATDNDGNSTTTLDTSNISIDSRGPTLTDDAITLTGGSGVNGAFILNDTITVNWDNSPSGNNNSNISTAIVDMSVFGGNTTENMTQDENGIFSFSLPAPPNRDEENLNVTLIAIDNIGNKTIVSDTSNASVDTIAPILTDEAITLSGASGTNNIFIMGDTLTYTWDDSQSGDGNGEEVSLVTIDLSAYGGSTSVQMNDLNDRKFSSSFQVTDGIEMENLNARITITDNAGNSVEITDTSNAIIDTKAPQVSDEAISISGATGEAGEYVSGDILLATWDDSVNGDNNGVEVVSIKTDLSQFGGATDVEMTNNGSRVFSASLALADNIQAPNQNISITAIDDAGNTTTVFDSSNAVLNTTASETGTTDTGTTGTGTTDSGTTDTGTTDTGTTDTGTTGTGTTDSGTTDTGTTDSGTTDTGTSGTGTTDTGTTDSGTTDTGTTDSGTSGTGTTDTGTTDSGTTDTGTTDTGTTDSGTTDTGTTDSGTSGTGTTDTGTTDSGTTDTGTTDTGTTDSGTSGTGTTDTGTTDTDTTGTGTTDSGTSDTGTTGTGTTDTGTTDSGTTDSGTTDTGTTGTGTTDSGTSGTGTSDTGTTGTGTTEPETPPAPASSSGASSSRLSSTKIKANPRRKPNQAPSITNPLPDVSLSTQNAEMTINLVSANGPVFTDPENNPMTYRVSDFNSTIISASITDSSITLKPLRSGLSTITVSASDGLYTTGEQFNVMVTESDIKNLSISQGTNQEGPVQLLILNPKAVTTEDNNITQETNEEKEEESFENEKPVMLIGSDIFRLAPRGSVIAQQNSSFRRNPSTPLYQANVSFNEPIQLGANVDVFLEDIQNDVVVIDFDLGEFVGAVLDLFGFGGDDKDEGDYEDADGKTYNKFEPQNRKGTAKKDIINTGIRADSVRSFSGPDIVVSRAGDDFVLLGGGDDKADLGKGDDIARAGDGDDVVLGKDGRDLISPGKGDDKSYGGRGHDRYQMNRGWGKDEVADASLTGTMSFPGSSLKELSFSRDGNNLIIKNSPLKLSSAGVISEDNELVFMEYFNEHDRLGRGGWVFETDDAKLNGAHITGATHQEVNEVLQNMYKDRTKAPFGYKTVKNFKDTKSGGAYSIYRSERVATDFVTKDFDAASGKATERISGVVNTDRSAIVSVPGTDLSFNPFKLQDGFPIVSGKDLASAITGGKSQFDAYGQQIINDANQLFKDGVESLTLVCHSNGGTVCQHVANELGRLHPDKLIKMDIFNSPGVQHAIEGYDPQNFENIDTHIYAFEQDLVSRLGQYADVDKFTLLDYNTLPSSNGLAGKIPFYSSHITESYTEAHNTFGDFGVSEVGETADANLLGHQAPIEYNAIYESVGHQFLYLLELEKIASFILQPTKNRSLASQSIADIKVNGLEILRVSFDEVLHSQVARDSFFREVVSQSKGNSISRKDRERRTRRLRNFMTRELKRGGFTKIEQDLTRIEKEIRSLEVKFRQEKILNKDQIAERNILIDLGTLSLTVGRNMNARLQQLDRLGLEGTEEKTLLANFIQTIGMQSFIDNPEVVKDVLFTENGSELIDESALEEVPEEPELPDSQKEVSKKDINDLIAAANQKKRDFEGAIKTAKNAIKIAKGNLKKPKNAVKKVRDRLKKPLSRLKTALKALYKADSSVFLAQKKVAKIQEKVNSISSSKPGQKQKAEKILEKVQIELTNSQIKTNNKAQIVTDRESPVKDLENELIDVQEKQRPFDIALGQARFDKRSASTRLDDIGEKLKRLRQLLNRVNNKKVVIRADLPKIEEDPVVAEFDEADFEIEDEDEEIVRFLEMKELVIESNEKIRAFKDTLKIAEGKLDDEEKKLDVPEKKLNSIVKRFRKPGEKFTKALRKLNNADFNLAVALGKEISFSTQLQALENRLENVKKKATQKKIEVAIKKLKNKISKVGDQVSSAQDAVKKAEEELKPFQDRIQGLRDEFDIAREKLLEVQILVQAQLFKVFKEEIRLKDMLEKKKILQKLQKRGKSGFRIYPDDLPDLEEDPVASFEEEETTENEAELNSEDEELVSEGSSRLFFRALDLNAITMNNDVPPLIDLSSVTCNYPLSEKIGHHIPSDFHIHALSHYGTEKDADRIELENEHELEYITRKKFAGGFPCETYHHFSEHLGADIWDKGKNKLKGVSKKQSRKNLQTLVNSFRADGEDLRYNSFFDYGWEYTPAGSTNHIIVIKPEDAEEPSGRGDLYKKVNDSDLFMVLPHPFGSDAPVRFGKRDSVSDFEDFMDKGYRANSADFDTSLLAGIEFPTRFQRNGSSVRERTIAKTERFYQALLALEYNVIPMLNGDRHSADNADIGNYPLTIMGPEDAAGTKASKEGHTTLISGSIGNDAFQGALGTRSGYASFTPRFFVSTLADDDKNKPMGSEINFHDTKNMDFYLYTRAAQNGAIAAPNANELKICAVHGSYNETRKNQNISKWVEYSELIDLKSSSGNGFLKLSFDLSQQDNLKAQKIRESSFMYFKVIDSNADCASAKKTETHVITAAYRNSKPGLQLRLGLNDKLHVAGDGHIHIFGHPKKNNFVDKIRGKKGGSHDVYLKTITELKNKAGFTCTYHHSTDHVNKRENHQLAKGNPSSLFLDGHLKRLKDQIDIYNVETAPRECSFFSIGWEAGIGTNLGNHKERAHTLVYFADDHDVILRHRTNENKNMSRSFLFNEIKNASKKCGDGNLCNDSISDALLAVAHPERKKTEINSKKAIAQYMKDQYGIDEENDELSAFIKNRFMGMELIRGGTSKRREQPASLLDNEHFFKGLLHNGFKVAPMINGDRHSTARKEITILDQTDSIIPQGHTNFLLSFDTQLRSTCGLDTSKTLSQADINECLFYQTMLKRRLYALYDRGLEVSTKSNTGDLMGSTINFKQTQSFTVALQGKELIGNNYEVYAVMGTKIFNNTPIPSSAQDIKLVRNNSSTNSQTASFSYSLPPSIKKDDIHFLYFKVVKNDTNLPQDESNKRIAAITAPYFTDFDSSESANINPAAPSISADFKEATFCIQKGQSNAFDLGNIFSDPEGKKLTYSITSGGGNKASVVLRKNRDGEMAVLNYQANKTDEKLIEITARDMEGFETTWSFILNIIGKNKTCSGVTVPPPNPFTSNQSPTLDTRITNNEHYCINKGQSEPVELMKVFNDEDGDVLEYSISRSGGSIASVEIKNGNNEMEHVLEYTGRKKGTKKIEIRAKDFSGQSVVWKFKLTVLGVRQDCRFPNAPFIPDDVDLSTLTPIDVTNWPAYFAEMTSNISIANTKLNTSRQNRNTAASLIDTAKTQISQAEAMSNNTNKILQAETELQSAQTRLNLIQGSFISGQSRVSTSQSTYNSAQQRYRAAKSAYQSLDRQRASAKKHYNKVSSDTSSAKRLHDNTPRRPKARKTRRYNAWQAVKAQKSPAYNTWQSLKSRARTAEITKNQLKGPRDSAERTLNRANKDFRDIQTRYNNRQNKVLEAQRNFDRAKQKDIEKTAKLTKSRSDLNQAKRLLMTSTLHYNQAREYLITAKSQLDTLDTNKKVSKNQRNNARSSYTDTKRKRDTIAVKNNEQDTRLSNTAKRLENFGYFLSTIKFSSQAQKIEIINQPKTALPPEAQPQIPKEVYPTFNTPPAYNPTITPIGPFSIQNSHQNNLRLQTRIISFLKP